MSATPKSKAWEIPSGQQNGISTSNQNAVASSSKIGLNGSSSAANQVATSSSTSGPGGQGAPPQVPDRPTEWANGAGAVTANGYGGIVNPYQSRYAANGYGGYSGLGGIGGYGSGAYGGGYGGYGGGYGMGRLGGGYGYGGYGAGGYGVGNMGGPGEGFPSLTSSLQSSTAPAFAIIESLVTAFSSVAQLVESTYMATHSSFFAMVGVADQLGSLKSYLGQVLGVFSVLRLGRRIIAWLRGKRSAEGGWANEWVSGIPSGSSGGGPRPSVKPLVLFLLSAMGLPYLMSRLIKLLIRHQQSQLQQQQQQQQAIDGVPLDPDKLTFARAKWEFRKTEEWELGLGRDEIVAVLEVRPGRRRAGEGAEGAEEVGWWRGRTRDGRIGWFPGNYVEVIRRREEGRSQNPGSG